MTKCDFCLDNLEQGLPPACVAACPMRVLDYGEMTRETESIKLALWEMNSEEAPLSLANVFTYPAASRDHAPSRDEYNRNEIRGKS